MRSRLAGIALAVVAATPPAHAQRVRGALTDSVTREKVPGAVVVLYDSAGRGLARSITDAQGEYSVARFPTTRTMGVLRIGYRPSSTPVGDADSVINLRLQPIPPLLGSVQATENRVCVDEAKAGAALDLWQQARAGLLASLVSREASPPRLRLRTYRRTIDPVLHKATADTAVYSDVVDARSFVAAHQPWVFAEHGYMRESSDGSRDYYAPDESVLLDPTFADTHCLHVIEGRGPRSSQVGMAFDPIVTRERDTLVDITGALWLDRTTFVPRAIEFRYTNLERESRDAGGEIDFATMPNGISMIERWQIRSSILGFEVPSVPSGLARRTIDRRDRRNVQVLGYLQIGGQIASAVWPDGKRWASDLPRIQGTLVDFAGDPVPHAVVWLREASDTVQTDSLGRFRFAPMMPGLYTVMASDTVLASHGIVRALPSNATLFATASVNLQLRFYSRADVFPTICPSRSYRPGTGVLLAHVIDAKGVSVPDAQIEVETVVAGDSTDTHPRALRIGTTSDDGRFVVCGAERDHRLIVRAYKGSDGAGISVDRWGDEVISVALMLHPLKS